MAWAGPSGAAEGGWAGGSAPGQQGGWQAPGVGAWGSAAYASGAPGGCGPCGGGSYGGGQHGAVPYGSGPCGGGPCSGAYGYQPQAQMYGAAAYGAGAAFQGGPAYGGGGMVQQPGGYSAQAGVTGQDSPGAGAGRVTDWLAPPTEEVAAPQDAAGASLQPAPSMRARELISSTLRRRPSKSKSSLAGAPEGRVRKRRPASERVAEEKGKIAPLRLARVGRELSCRLYSLVSSVLPLLVKEPASWLEPMFELPKSKDEDDTYEDVDQSEAEWMARDDGLYRAATNVNLLEPWNHERLQIQLGRSIFSEPARGSTATQAIQQELADHEADDDREVLGCGLCAPHPAHKAGGMGPPQDLSLRTRSHTRMKRRQLMATQLYELRLDVTRATLLCAPTGAAAGAFDSEEGREAALLQELYSRYRKELEADMTMQLDARLDALMELGRALEKQAAEEKPKAQQPDPEPAGAPESGGAQEAYMRHLEERRKLRARRDEGQRRLEKLCKELYEQWRRLVDVRRRQGFTSTPWRLRAQEEAHDALEDADRRRRNVEAEVAELASSADPTKSQRTEQEVRELQELVETNWDKLRAPGMPTYRFQLTASQELTPTEGLKALFREGGDGAVAFKEEIQRRRLINRARVCVVCRVGTRIVGRSPLFPLHWDTWSTASHVVLQSSSVGQDSRAVPLHSFDLAVHFMPKSVFLTVHVATGGRFSPCRSWSTSSEAEVEIPGQDGRRVTHAAVLEQRLQFGLLAAEGGGSDSAAGGFGGELVVQASWPSDNTGGLVVPPRQSYEDGRRVRDVAMQALLPCRQPPLALVQHRRPNEKPDERLAGLRYDPQDPENARALLESAAPRALPGYDVDRLGLEHGQLKAPDASRSKRLKQLQDRAERMAHSTERVVVPAFEKEVKLDDHDEEQHHVAKNWDVSTPRAQAQHRDNFVRRIQARLRKTAIVKTHVSYKSIVREHGQEIVEVEETQWLKVLARLFQPKQTLRPAGERRRLETAARVARVHVSLSKLHNAPIRVAGRSQAGGSYGAQPPAGSLGSGYSLPSTYGGASAGQPPVGSYGGWGAQGYGGTPATGLASQAGSLAHGGSSFYVDQHVSVFGAPKGGLPEESLPQIVVEMSLEDLDGNLLRDRTRATASSASPDINQILELALAAGSKGELTQENLASFSGHLSINVFDEVLVVLPERGGELRQRRQRRFLGSFCLPWSTLYAAKCSIKGHFRVEQPIVTFGYRTRAPIPGSASAITDAESAGAVAAREGAGETTGLLGSNSLEEDTAELQTMYIAVDVTVDPALVPPERVASQNFYPGAEPRLLLKHVQRWIDSFQAKKDRVQALGTDIEGRSRLICRYVRPQVPPPHLNPGDPFAIEAAARYVSLIPFLCDNEMFPTVTDLWCTDQEFLNIQCGDWEEHAILLCNYFNYIDRYRREKVEGWLNTDIQSYVAQCTVVPQGEVSMVVRRDCQSGHCEFWQAASGECYFVPYRKKQGRKLCPGRKGDSQDGARAQLPGSPFVPVQRVDILFNQENVWANLQTLNKESPSSVRGIDFDVDNPALWKPLFLGGIAEMRKLSGLRDTTPEPSVLSGRELGSSTPASIARISQAYELEDPTQKLVYEPADAQHAARLERKFQEDLEAKIREHRATGEASGVQMTTAFNHVLAMRLGELLEDLEKYCGCHRTGGMEAVFPLRSSGPEPVSHASVVEHMQRIEQEFQRLDGGRRSVYGLPLNKPYTDFNRVWQSVRDSRVLELGEEGAVYALKVRVFPYASGVLSVWVFIACASSMDG